MGDETSSTRETNFWALTARELMTPVVETIRENATLPEALALMTRKGLSGLPVVNEAGAAQGVLSSADIVVHAHESTAQAPEKVGSGSEEAPRVRDLMTPVVFAVSPETRMAKVIEELLDMKVQRIFVAQEDVLIGVITPLDILKHLHEEAGA